MWSGLPSPSRSPSSFVETDCASFTVGSDGQCPALTAGSTAACGSPPAPVSLWPDGTVAVVLGTVVVGSPRLSTVHPATTVTAPKRAARDRHRRRSIGGSDGTTESLAWGRGTPTAARGP